MSEEDVLVVTCPVCGIDMNKKRSKEDVDRLERYMTHLVGVIRNCKSSD